MQPALARAEAGQRALAGRRGRREVPADLVGLRELDVEAAQGGVRAKGGEASPRLVGRLDRLGVGAAQAERELQREVAARLVAVVADPRGDGDGLPGVRGGLRQSEHGAERGPVGQRVRPRWRRLAEPGERHVQPVDALAEQP